MNTALRIARNFMEEWALVEAGTAIRVLLQQASQLIEPGKEGLKRFLTKDVLEEARKHVQEERYQKHVKNVPGKAKELLEDFFTWQLMKDKSGLDRFLSSHPDFLIDPNVAKNDIQKIWGKIKDGDTGMDNIETVIYPNIKNFSDSEFNVSANPHSKELNVPNMPSGQQWVLITDEEGNPIEECRGEAEAMHHCGRSVGGEMLSLRDDKGRSHMTADRTPNKELIQLKFSGNRILRGNLERFRPYIPAIEALLMSDEIKSVPDHIMNDISVLDLGSKGDKSFIEDVLKNKPSLITKREKEVLLPLYEKMWEGKLDIDELIERLSI